MESINMGSLYMNQNPSRAVSNIGPFPQPRDIGKIIRCFDEWRLISRPGHASDTYSYLSEFAHPNMAAFEHYYKMETSAGRKIFANFADTPGDVAHEPLANVAIAAAATLYNLSELLNLLGDKGIAETLNRSLNSLVNSGGRSPGPQS